MATLSLFAAATDSRVDAENGILRGVRVITKGEAKTHSFLGCPIICDDITISDVIREAATFVDGVPVKLAHGTDIEELVGSIRGIYADGDCARGDLYLLKTHESFATLIEMAQTMPSNFGVSISFLNLPEPVMNTGLDEDGDGGIAPEYQDEIVAYAARVVEGGLFSADLVSNPSCNPSLFSIMPDTTTPEEVPVVAPVEEVLSEEITPIVETVITSSEPAPETAEEVVEEVVEVIVEVAPKVSEEIEPVSPEESLVSKEEFEVKGPEGTQNLPEDVKIEAPSKDDKDAKKEIPAPAELSRTWGAVTTDLEATRTELSAVRSELSAVKSELSAAQSELSKRDSELVDLRYLHRAVLGVMGLSASVEIPEIATPFNAAEAYSAAVESGNKQLAAELFANHKKAIFAARNGK